MTLKTESDIVHRAIIKKRLHHKVCMISHVAKQYLKGVNIQNFNCLHTS